MRERWLFLGLALVLLVPIWAVDYLPTIDGPSHVYNAWILRQYANTEEYPLFQQHFEIDWRPIPNWFGHAALALLMFPFEPRVAEKVLLTLLVLLFVATARFFRLRWHYRPMAEIGPGRVYRRKGRDMRE